MELVVVMSKAPVRGVSSSHTHPAKGQTRALLVVLCYADPLLSLCALKASELQRRGRKRGDKGGIRGKSKPREDGGKVGRLRSVEHQVLKVSILDANDLGICK